MRFLETPVFTAKVQAIGAEDALRELQVILGQYPTAGPVIAGTGGFRKVRMKLDGRGKSGSARVIYLLLPEMPCIAFFLVYTKGEADNISSAGKAFLRKAALDIKDHQHLIP